MSQQTITRLVNRMRHCGQAVIDTQGDMKSYQDEEIPNACLYLMAFNDINHCGMNFLHFPFSVFET